MSEAKDSAKNLFNRSVSFLKNVSGRIEEGVKRTYEVSALKIEVASHRRAIDEALRDLGQRAHDLLRYQGRVTADELRSVLERLEELEATIAEKERRIADAESEIERAREAETGPAHGGSGHASPEPPLRPSAAAAPAEPERKPARKTAKKKTATKKKTAARQRAKTAGKTAGRKRSAKSSAKKTSSVRKPRG